MRTAAAAQMRATSCAAIAIPPHPPAGASVVGASVAGASVAGASVAGASVAGASVVGASVAGASVAGASVVGASAASPSITVEVWSTSTAAASENAGVESATAM